MSEKIHVREAAGLLEFLRANLKDWSRNTIKQRLQEGCVSVNAKRTTKHDYKLKAGDLVEVSAPAKNTINKPTQLEILYFDHDVVAINKPSGMLAVGTTTETQLHALAILRHQMSREMKSVKLWPVNRIDRDTSGVMLFARSREVREEIKTVWNTAEKIYLAVVLGCPDPASGTIDQPLRLDEVVYHMHVGKHRNADPAITHYKTIRTAGGRSLLEVQIETGRQHQIRAHLSWLGYPVVGDSRYGKSGGRMGLHSLRLKITKPGNAKPFIFEAPAPADFLSLMPKDTVKNTK